MSGKPLPYTTNPISLLAKDVSLFIRLTLDFRRLSLLSIIWPFRPSRSKLDELALTCRNVWAISVHSVLIVAQLGFLGFVLTTPVCGIPALPYFGAIFAGVQVNKVLCDLTLNGWGHQVFYAGGQYATDQSRPELMLESRDPAHSGERWVFVNGVAVGSHWMDSNLKRIAKTFRRPVLGVHNSTYGIVFDVLECVLQRTFSYPTLDIRTAYKTIADLLRKPEVKKLVVVAHSQGSIELGMALDWIYATASNAEVAKLEVYTFGNAANHWNSPEVAPGVRAINHVEHYANTNDWVSRFGVLSFRGVGLRQPADLMTRAGAALGKLKRSITGELAPDALSNRFVGKLFLRKASGHQFNQHYLNNMFAMDASNEVVLERNEFMDNVANASSFEDGRARSAAAGGSQDVNNGANGAQSPQQIKQESRLWEYRNGRVPEE